MKLTILLYFTILSILTTFSLSAKELNTSHKKLAISNLQHQEIFKDDDDPYINHGTYSSNNANIASSNNKVVVILDSLQGVLDANLPFELESEILEQQGYSNWNLTDEQLEEKFDRMVIDIEAMNSAFGLSGEVRAASFCSKKVVNRTKTTNTNINITKNKSKDLNSNNTSGTLSTSIKVEGGLNITVNYRRRSRCGFVYNVSVKSLKAELSAELQAKLSAFGEANYTVSSKLFNDTINIFDTDVVSGWIYFVYYDIDAKFDIEYGVNLDFTAAASFNSNYTAEGNINIEWTCDRKSCQKNSNEFNFEYTRVTDDSYEVQVEAILTPYVEPQATIDLDIYEYFDIANAQAGIKLALPIRYYYYNGTMCSDGNNDGKNDHITASLFDVSAEIEAYVGLGILGKTITKSIDLNLSNWAEIKRGKRKFYRKNIYFKDLNGNSNIFTPKLSLPPNQNYEEGFLITGTRKCYPFEADVTLVVNWGNGQQQNLTLPVQQTETVMHQWGLGSFDVSVKIVSDAAGRYFNSDSSSSRVNTSVDGSSAFIYSYEAPKYNNLILGSSSWYPAFKTVKQYCIEHGHEDAYNYYSKTSYGAGHYFYSSGIWRTYGGQKFDIITKIYCESFSQNAIKGEKVYYNIKKGSNIGYKYNDNMLKTSVLKWCQSEGYRSYKDLKTKYVNYKYYGTPYTYFKDYKWNTSSNTGAYIVEKVTCLGS
ncbi:hypothetical protein [Algibacillus agarilyticus]|uniref:hypothetical protein n=1 Tax=Algibacillus agarilyticus TaxID=2234133 RepID=UPI000DCF847D|nr:hypothetical protein [Algibacillus agarilyticus]